MVFSLRVQGGPARRTDQQDANKLRVPDVAKVSTVTMKVYFLCLNFLLIYLRKREPPAPCAESLPNCLHELSLGWAGSKTETQSRSST